MKNKGLAQHHMKRLLLSAAVLFSCLVAFGQREIIKVDWDVIRGIVAEKPDEVRELVKRLSAPTLDATLTYEERIIAFYGQSLLSKGKEWALTDDVMQLFSQGKYEKALAKANEVLAINPLNIRVLDRAGRCVYKLIEAGNTSYTKEDGSLFFNRAMRLFNTIAMTGYGTEEYPFCVTSVDDEYEFMYRYLELYEIDKQSLVGHCDVFTLKETSRYFSDKELYFDATRPLEMLSELFGE